MLQSSVETIRVTVVGEELVAEPLWYTKTAPSVETAAINLVRRGHEVTGTPVPCVSLHPRRTLDHTAPSALACVVLEVDLKHFLLVTVTLDVEVVHVAVARNESVFARVDDLLQVSLCLVVLASEEVSLTSESPCESLGHANGTVNVGCALALVEVGSSLLTFFCHPKDEVFVRDWVLRILVAVVWQCVTCED